MIKMIKTDILKCFLKNTKLINQMKECEHGTDISLNPYHLEGTVFCHTLLVFNAACHYKYQELIMALCHDIGKIYTRKYNEMTKKVSFYGHSDASIQPTIDFLYELLQDKIITYNQLCDFIKNCLSPIGNHMLFYQNINKLNYLSNNNTKIKENFLRMAIMDSVGSISETEKLDDLTNEYDSFIKMKYRSDLPTATIWVGLPCSGKDYLAKNENVLSFDNIRLEIYGKTLTDKEYFSLSEKKLYEKAWIYCNEHKKINLNNELIKKIKEIPNENINICNTSLTRKARRSLINILYKKFNIKIKQVFTPSYLLKERNKKRTSKFIPPCVFKKMKEYMTIVTHFEKHIYDIEYIINDEIGDLNNV